MVVNISLHCSSMAIICRLHQQSGRFPRWRRSGPILQQPHIEKGDTPNIMVRNICHHGSERNCTNMYIYECMHVCMYVCMCVYLSPSPVHLKEALQLDVHPPIVPWVSTHHQGSVFRVSSLGLGCPIAWSSESAWLASSPLGTNQFWSSMWQRDPHSLCFDITIFWWWNINDMDGCCMVSHPINK
jgi:hypothetical protein